MGPLKKTKYTLQELLAETPPDLVNNPEIIEWDRMPAVGCEWPNPGWDEVATSPNKPVAENTASRPARNPSAG